MRPSACSGRRGSRRRTCRQTVPPRRSSPSTASGSPRPPWRTPSASDAAASFRTRSREGSCSTYGERLFDPLGRRPRGGQSVEVLQRASAPSIWQSWVALQQRQRAAAGGGGGGAKSRRESPRNDMMQASRARVSGAARRGHRARERGAARRWSAAQEARAGEGFTSWKRTQTCVSAYSEHAVPPCPSHTPAKTKPSPATTVLLSSLGSFAGYVDLCSTTVVSALACSTRDASGTGSLVRRTPLLGSSLASCAGPAAAMAPAARRSDARAAPTDSAAAGASQAQADRQTDSLCCSADLILFGDAKSRKSTEARLLFAQREFEAKLFVEQTTVAPCSEARRGLGRRLGLLAQPLQRLREAWKLVRTLRLCADRLVEPMGVRPDQDPPLPLPVALGQ